MALPISGLDPAPLSGLNFAGPGGLSGTGQPSMSGGTGGGGVQPGMQGGFSLSDLNLLQLLQSIGGGGDAVGGNVASLLSGIGGGIGQTGGGGGGGGGAVSGGLGGPETGFIQAGGGPSGGGVTPSRAGGGRGLGIDPLSLIAKLFGLGSKGFNLFSQIQGSGGGSQGGGGSESLGGFTGTASPTVGGGLGTGDVSGAPGFQLDESGNLMPSLGSLFGPTWEGGGTAISPDVWRALQNLPPDSPLSGSGGVPLPDASGHFQIPGPPGSGGAIGADQGGGFGPSQIGAGFSGIEALLDLVRSVRSGKPLNIGQSLFGLANSGPQSINALTGSNLPTLGGLLSGPIDAGLVAALGGGETALGLTGSELGAALASGALQGGTSAAEAAAIPSAEAGLGSLAAVALPITAILTDLFGPPSFNVSDKLQAKEEGAANVARVPVQLQRLRSAFFNPTNPTDRGQQAQAFYRAAQGLVPLRDLANIAGMSGKNEHGFQFQNFSGLGPFIQRDATRLLTQMINAQNFFKGAPAPGLAQGLPGVDPGFLAAYRAPYGPQGFTQDRGEAGGVLQGVTPAETSPFAPWWAPPMTATNAAQTGFGGAPISPVWQFSPEDLKGFAGATGIRGANLAQLQALLGRTPALAPANTQANIVRQFLQDPSQLPPFPGGYGEYQNLDPAIAIALAKTQEAEV